MASPRLTPALLALLALSCAGVAAGLPTAPAFLWANTEHLACGATGQTSRVVYEVTRSPAATLAVPCASVLRPGACAARPHHNPTGCLRGSDP